MTIKAHGDMPKRWGGIKCERCHQSDLIEARPLPGGWCFTLERVDSRE